VGDALSVGKSDMVSDFERGAVSEKLYVPDSDGSSVGDSDLVDVTGAERDDDVEMDIDLGLDSVSLRVAGSVIE